MRSIFAHNCKLVTINFALQFVVKSPGYPSTNYPKMLDCIYMVVIPSGMAMNVSFEDFYIEDDSTCE